MKKIRIILAVIAVLLLSIAALAIIFSNMFPSGYVKTAIEKRLSSDLNREVKIEHLSFNIFSGIKLSGLTISNARGFSPGPFVSCESAELKYAFWPLFQGKVIIPEIAFIKPQILIEKDYSGDFNFPDIFTKSPPKPKRKVKKKATVPAQNAAATTNKGNYSLVIFINNFKITDGQVIYQDYYLNKSGLKNLDVSISNVALATVKPIDFDASADIIYQGKIIPVSISSTIAVDLKAGKIAVKDFTSTIAGDTLSASAEIENYSSAPKININASSPKINLDYYLGLFAPGAPMPKKATKSSYGVLTRSIKATFSNVPKGMVVSANFSLNNISLKNLLLDKLDCSFLLKKRTLNFKVKNFSAYKGTLYASNGYFDFDSLAYGVDRLELKNFNASPFLNDLIDSFYPSLLEMKNKTEGTLSTSINLKSRGVEMPDAFDNLSASGVVVLSKGRFKSLKSLSSIGDKYNISLLKQDVYVSGLRLQAQIANKVLNVVALTLQDTDLRVTFSGKLDFNKMVYLPGNRLSLFFSPSVTQVLPKEFSLLKDNKGFISAIFELQGSLYRPFPSPTFQNVIEAVVGNLQVKIEAKKIEVVTNAKTIEAEAQKKLEEQKKLLEEQAKNKVKKILKF